MLTFVFLALVQLCLVLYMRNVMVSAAAAGARYGASLGVDPAQAVARTQQYVDAGLPGAVRATATGSLASDGGLTVVQIDLRAPLPAIGLFSLGGTLHATGHAFKEGQ